MLTAALCLAVGIDLQASYAADKFAKRAKPAINNTVAPSGGSNNVVPTGGNAGSNVVTQAQLKKLVEANPGGAIEAVKEALNQLQIPGSGTVDQTVLNYIMG